MEMHSVDSTESQGNEKKKKSSSKILSTVGIELKVSNFHALHDTV